MSQTYKCQFDEHYGESIIGYCLNQECKLPPQCCVNCMQKKHTNHQDDCKGIKSINILLKQLISEHSDLEKCLLSQLQSVKQRIDKLIKDQKSDQDQLLQMDKLLSESKYQEFKNNIQFLRSQYFKSKLNPKTESERQGKLINQFIYLCEQQKKLLSQFNLNLQDLQYNEGMELMKSRQFKDAIIKFDQILTVDQLNCNALSKKGQALWQLRQYNEAFFCLDQGLQINPNHSDLNLEKGNLLSILKDYKQGLAYQDKAILLNPENAQAYVGKGYTLGRLQKYDEEIKCYDRAIQLDPNYGLAYKNKGQSLIDLKKYEESILCYDKAIQLDPNNPEQYRSKGVSLEKLKQYKKAIECYELAVQKGYEPKQELQELISDLKKK